MQERRSSFVHMNEHLAEREASSARAISSIQLYVDLLRSFRMAAVTPRNIPVRELEGRNRNQLVGGFERY